jgi:hypothetical protein
MTRARAKSRPADSSDATPKQDNSSKQDNARLAERLEDYCIEALATIPPAKIEETARQWIAKAKLEAGEATNAFQLLEAFALAGHLLLFTASLTGATPIERFVRQNRADASPEGRLALDALTKASFRLLRLTSRISRETFFVEDIASGETLTLFDAEIPDGALGATLAARIAPLPDGGFATVGPLTPLDAAALAEALSFVREGRGLINPQRCAAAVYKHVTRHGGFRLEGADALPRELFDDIEAVENEDEFDDLDRLAFAIEAKKKRGQEPQAEDMSEARRLTSFESLAQALARSVISRQYRRDVLADVFSQLAFIMMETYARRAAVGAGGEENPLQSIAAALDRAIAERRLPKESRALYEDLRGRLTISRNLKHYPLQPRHSRMPRSTSCTLAA